MFWDERSTSPPRPPDHALTRHDNFDNKQRRDDVLDSFPAFASTGDVLPGCLITNTATELAPTPDTSHHSMVRYIDRLTNAFTNALQNSATGTPDVTAMARFLTTTMLGMFVMIRARTDAQLLQDTVDAALDYVEGNLGRSH